MLCDDHVSNVYFPIKISYTWIYDRSTFNRICVCVCFDFSLLRTQLLQSDFATNVKLLQHFPETDINVVLSKAALL